MLHGRMNQPLPLRTGAWISTLLLLGTCEAGVMETGEPVDVELTSDLSEVSVGDSVRFEAEAVGRNLAAVRIDFMDGRVDTLGAHGAVEASLTEYHAYDEDGDFRVRAEAEEIEGEWESDEVTVRVVP